MSEIFLTALSLSLSGAAMILIVLLLSKLFKNRISGNWRYYIWLLVVLRLLVPYSPEISIFGALSQREAERSISDSAPVPQAEVPANPDAVLSGAVHSAPDPTPNPAPADNGIQDRMIPAVSGNITTIVQSIVPWLWVPWLLVALILLIRKITLYQSFAKYVRAGQTDVSDEALLMEFSEICAQAGIKRAIELRTNSLIASPLLLGVLRPCVILPTTDIPREDRRYIYLHELNHYRRGDILYKWLLQLTLCLHWFNPLVHVMVREANQSCELSCDASVIRSMDVDERRGYGDALLKSLEAPGSYRESLAAVTLHENSVLLKERLESIKEYRKNNKWRMIVSVILCLAIFAGGVALGAYIPSMAAISEPNGGELTPEGLPIMSASNRNAYEKYIGKIFITGMLRRNFSPEDISELVSHGSTRLLTLVNALESEEFEKNDYFDGTVPADWADTVLTTYFPLYQAKIREVCADIYDAETNTYRYIGGLGGGPALPIVTGFQRSGKLLTIQYTWYVGGSIDDEFHYMESDSGELIIEINGDTFRYRSNRVIERPEAATDANSVSSAEGYNIREKYGLIVVNDQYEKMLMALVSHGITHTSWNSPEEIEPDRLVLYFHAMGFGSILNEINIDYDKYENDDGWTLIPAEEIENAVERHFDVSAAHMRESDYYIADRNIYWFGGLGSLANAKITSVQEDGGICLIAYELYHDIEYIGSGTLKIRIGERQNDYQYLSNEFNPVPLTPEQQKLKDSYIRIGKDMTLEEKITAALVCSGNATITWNRAKECPQYDLLSIYDFMVQIGEVDIPEGVEFDPYLKKPYYLPMEDMEAVVTSHYDVAVEYLRAYHGFDQERRTYIVPTAYSQDICIIESRRDGNLIHVRYGVYYSYELARSGEITATILENGGFRYVSCVMN